MNFHESTTFPDAVAVAAEVLGIRPVLIEKDYWVTYVLRKLAFSAYSDMLVFKGGTSLSKAYNCIERFSEDIDLALLPQEGMNGTKTKKLLSEIDHAITDGMEYVKGDKKGRNRKTWYNYPKTQIGQSFGAVKEQIQVEINAFTNPVPYVKLPIKSYLYDFLLARGNLAIIKEHDLLPFELNILSLERTFFEKTLSLNRLSYYGTDILKEKIRHFYDLHQLYHRTDLQKNIFEDKSFAILSLVLSDDASIQTFDGEWKGKSFGDSPLFASLEILWETLTPTYLEELSNLIWTGTLPTPAEILEVMQMIRSFMQRYDQNNKLDRLMI